MHNNTLKSVSHDWWVVGFWTKGTSRATVEKSLPGPFSARWVFKGTIRMFGNTLFPCLSWTNQLCSERKMKSGEAFSTRLYNNSWNWVQSRETGEHGDYAGAGSKCDLAEEGWWFLEVEAPVWLSSSGQNAPWGSRLEVVNDAKTTQDDSWSPKVDKVVVKPKSSRKFEKQPFVVVFRSSLNVKNPSSSDKLAKSTTSSIVS